MSSSPPPPTSNKAELLRSKLNDRLSQSSSSPPEIPKTYKIRQHADDDEEAISNVLDDLMTNYDDDDDLMTNYDDDDDNDSFPPMSTSAPAKRSLHVGIVGLPNAGKSLLLNSLIGKTVSAVSPKSHTTRTSTLGIMTLDAEVRIVWGGGDASEASERSERALQ